MTEEVQAALTLIGLSMLAVGFTWWRRSLLVAIPMVLFAYALFVFWLFKAPFWLVAACWAVCAALTVFGAKIVFSWPVSAAGQFSVGRVFVGFLTWPVISMISALAVDDQLRHKKQTAKKKAARKARREAELALEGQIEGTIGFVEAAGIEGEFLMVFIAEYGNMVFYAPADTASGLRQGKRFLLQVERRDEEQLGGDVPWIAGLKPLGN